MAFSFFFIQKIKKIFTKIDDIYDAIYPLWPLILLSITPPLLLGFDAQGKEIVTILVSKFSHFSFWNKLLFCSNFGIFSAYFSGGALLHAMAVVGYKNNLDKENNLDEKKLPENGRVFNISKKIIPFVAILFSLGILIVLMGFSSGYDRFWFFSSIIFSIVLIPLYYQKKFIDLFKGQFASLNQKRAIKYHIYNKLPWWILLITLFYFLSIPSYFGSKIFITCLFLGVVVVNGSVIMSFIKHKTLKQWDKIASIVATVLGILLIIYFFKSQFPSFTSLLFSFTFIFIIILKINYYSHKHRRPYGVLFTFWLLIISPLAKWTSSSVFNIDQQTTIRTLTNNNEAYQPQAIKTNYKQWLAHKSAEKLIDSAESTVYIIASEGGGIRSAFWTTGLLCKLDSLFPNLINKTYAFSGVSGGSIGAMFYCALKKDNQVLNAGDKWKKLLGEDYLANSLMGMTIGATIQSLVPFPLGLFDRARILEDDWAYTYKKNIKNGNINKNTLHESIYMLYPDSLHFSVPNVFFNTTHVESGKKAIVSNLNLGNTFPHDIDLLKIIGHPIPLKTAGLLSARFPGISPAGLIKNASGNNWGKIVDGGYFDNSGLLTAIDIVKMIIEQTPDSIHIKPVILFIRNADTSDKGKQGVSFELTAPLNAFLNSWTAKTEKTVKDMEWMTKELGFEFIQLKLDYQSKGAAQDYPLGWTLSKRTQRSILEKLNEIGFDDSNEIGRLNIETLKKLKTMDQK